MTNDTFNLGLLVIALFAFQLCFSIGSVYFVVWRIKLAEDRVNNEIAELQESPKPPISSYPRCPKCGTVNYTPDPPLISFWGVGQQQWACPQCCSVWSVKESVNRTYTVTPL